VPVPEIVNRVSKVRRGYDWGDRSANSAGVVSEVVDVGAVRGPPAIALKIRDLNRVEASRSDASGGSVRSA
jgi:hypothetical protein